MGIERNGKLCGSPAALLPERSRSRRKQTSSALSVPMLSSQVYLPVCEIPAATRAQGLEDGKKAAACLCILQTLRSRFTNCEARACWEWQLSAQFSRQTPASIVAVAFGPLPQLITCLLVSLWRETNFTESKG